MKTKNAFVLPKAISFGRAALNLGAHRHEWLVTNGLGSYACGTVSGALARSYHGYLIAALNPPQTRTLMLSKVDESLSYQAKDYTLSCNHWEANEDLAGLKYVERFHLEGTTPVWTFAAADALLQKRLWLKQGENSAYLHYHYLRGIEPLLLRGKVLINYRDHHAKTRASNWQMQSEPLREGLKITAFEGAQSLYLRSPELELHAEHNWYHNYYLATEAYRGLDALDDNLHIASFEVRLEPGQSVSLIASTEANASLDAKSTLKARRHLELQLIAQSNFAKSDDWLKQLVLAAEQFLVSRPLAKGMGQSVIAGYPWFSDWGRDTMIALAGLTLTTGKEQSARQILLTYAQFVSEGMLPNRFPDTGKMAEYNTADASLWYVEAIWRYWHKTKDADLLQKLFPVLKDIIDWHLKGTRYGIKVARDGLLAAGQIGVQLTWMDAKVGDWVVTPRIGKPVEINALWFNALCIMSGFAKELGHDGTSYQQLAERCQSSFQRFWHQAGYLYDVLDGPEGHDASFRPNQLFALSLEHSPLTKTQQKIVLDACSRQLLCSYGLHSLAAFELSYQAQYGGDPRKRDGSYHQGTVWSWLIGPFVAAHYRIYQDTQTARSFLEPFSEHVKEHGLGSISEIFDANAPFHARGAFAQAWGVAEVLRISALLNAAES